MLSIRIALGMRKMYLSSMRKMPQGHLISQVRNSEEEVKAAHLNSRTKVLVTTAKGFSCHKKVNSQVLTFKHRLQSLNTATCCPFPINAPCLSHFPLQETCMEAGVGHRRAGQKRRKRCDCILIKNKINLEKFSHLY